MSKPAESEILDALALAKHWVGRYVRDTQDESSVRPAQDALECIKSVYTKLQDSKGSVAS